MQLSETEKGRDSGKKLTSSTQKQLRDDQLNIGTAQGPYKCV